MVLNKHKIIFISPHPTWDADRQDRILQFFLKMQSGIEIKILPAPDIIKIFQSAVLGPLYSRCFLFSFARWEGQIRSDDQISVINFIGEDQLDLICFQFTGLDHTYLNVFNNEDILNELVLRGYRPDYSQDVIL